MDCDVAHELTRLDELLRRVDDLAGEEGAPAGSAWTVRRHLHHAALVAASVATLVRGLSKGRGEEGGPTSEAALAILEGGAIPRGVGEAPDFARPPDAPTPEEIRALAGKARDRLAPLAEQAGELSAVRRKFPHHSLGPLSAAEWLRFTAIHTAHHLEIIGL